MFVYVVMALLAHDLMVPAFALQGLWGIIVLRFVHKVNMGLIVC